MAALAAKLVMLGITEGLSTSCGPNWSQRMEYTFCCWDVSTVPMQVSWEGGCMWLVQCRGCLVEASEGKHGF